MQLAEINPVMMNRLLKNTSVCFIVGIITSYWWAFLPIYAQICSSGQEAFGFTQGVKSRESPQPYEFPLRHYKGGRIDAC